MKKKIITILLLIVIAIAVLVAVIVFSVSNNGELASGTYHITDFEEYPDAYIEVKDNSLQFYNIDLNAIYQKEQMEKYNKFIEKYPDSAISEEEVEKNSDLNFLFVDNPYYIDYEWEGDTKSGTFEYTYFLYPNENNISFGLVILYDSFHKTIHVNNAIQEMTFQK